LGAVYYYSSINQKDTKLSELEAQITDLNNQIANPKANIVTGLGISDVPPGPTSYPYDTLEFDYSHLWLTGWLLNSGAGIALNVKVMCWHMIIKITYCLMRLFQSLLQD